MNTEQSRPATETIVLVAVVLLLAALGYSVSTIMSPFVIAAALIYLLLPLRHTPLAGRFLWLAVMLFVIWFFYSLLGLLAPFIIAFLLAYMLNPLVGKLEHRRVPRWAACLGIVLALIGLTIAIALFVMPVAIQQFEGIISGVTSLVNDFSAYLSSGKLFEVLARFGISTEQAQEVIRQQISPRLEGILTALFQAVFGFISSLSGLVLQIINIVIIPFLLFYILKDLPEILTAATDLVAPNARPRFLDISRRFDFLLGRYLRGAVIVAFIQGCISGVALWIIGVDYALVLGIMTGLLNFIPYVGLLTSLAVSCIVALFSGGAVGTKVFLIVVVYLSQKLLEATVLGPKIIGPQVGLHPVLLILCLMVFGYFLGFVGMLIAVPATAFIIAGVKEWQTARNAVPPSSPIA